MIFGENSSKNDTSNPERLEKEVQEVEAEDSWGATSDAAVEETKEVKKVDSDLDKDFLSFDPASEMNFIR